jgi:hypothetical protein
MWPLDVGGQSSEDATVLNADVGDVLG